MDVFHIRGRKHAVVLAREVDEEGGGREPAGCGVGDAHGGVGSVTLTGGGKSLVLELF